MSRSQQDTVIDDDEETCPLCIEEFDLSDKNFRPCPCGYQICQFCFNSLKTTYEKSTCPNCRRVYDDKTIQYKIPTAEEVKLDQQNKIKKQAAFKRKESEKREVETSSRRNLAGVRVKQQNLVYVIGLVPSIKDENVLLQTLRGPEYFGQYGEIEKIVVSKAKPGAVNQGVGVYVTYATKEAAATCINTVDGSMNGDRVLRAQFGTTKYCSAYLRGEVCNNKSCSFLHETGEDGQTTTLQNEPMQAKAAQKPSYISQTSQYQPPARHQPVPPSTASSTSSSQPMVRQSSKDEPNSRKGSADASALPSSVSWANPNAPVIRTRRASQAASRSSPSPQISNATVASQKPEELRHDDTSNIPANPPPPASSTPPVPSPVNNTPSKSASVPEAKKEQRKPRDSLLDQLIASVSSPEFRFVFNDSAFSPEELAALERHSVMIDPLGGAKLRVKREREEAEQTKQEAEAHVKAQAVSQNQPSANEEAVEDEPFEGGSLALGGEPEENPRSIAARSAIQRPSQAAPANTFLNDQFLALNGRSLTPQQRQQMSVIGSSNLQQAPGLGHPMAQPFSAGGFEFEQRSGLSQAQAHHESFHGHARQHSRFNFSNDSAKPNTARYLTQQPSAGSQHFYTSGVQGPPPGLKTAGTPPISGGGMFAQGHGFTSNMSAGFGTIKDNNTDMLMRGRSGTNTGHDVSKREYLLSLQNTNLRSPPPSAPGLLNPLYGQYAGAYQDPGLVKQKKKGKKHRHANTSSSGGGVVDLADPSILQARLHQSGAGAGQGLFGGQNQDDIDFPPLAPVPVPRVSDTTNTLRSHVHSVRSSQDSTARSSTPKIPPGFSLPPAHPSPAHGQGMSMPPTQRKPTPATFGPVTPVVPIFPIDPRVPTPKAKPKDEPIVEMKAAKEDTEKSDDSKPDELPMTSSQDVESGNPGLRLPKKAGIKAETATADALENTVVAGGERHATDILSTVPIASPAVEQPARSVPEKLELTGVREAKLPSAVQSPAADQTQLLATSTAATPPSMSRPGTPATAASRTPESSAMRPKTLRITSAISQKPDTTPASAVTDKSIFLPYTIGKQRSRQPSVSSISRSRPSTPAISDHAYSNDVSRASSPPPSIVGSAPERSKTKNQIRKERKSKGKEATETNSEGPPTPVERKVEVQQPIVARQKKKRKAQDRSTGDDDSSPTVASENLDRKTPAAPEPMRVTKQQSNKNMRAAASSDQTSVRADDSVLEPQLGNRPSVSAAAKEEKITSSATPKEPYTLNQLLIDSGKANDPEAFKMLLDEHISNIQTLFSQLFDSKQLDQSSALFNLPPLTSYRLPPDSRRGADYLDGNGYTMSSPFGEVYLDSKQKRELQQGSVVHISDPNRPNDLLRRTMVTKSGRVYRHLSQEEEDRALALERRREEDEQKYGELGAKEMLMVDSADLMNIQGGLDELLKHGDRHGISWIMNESENIDGDLDEEDDASYPIGDDEPGELANLAGGWQAAEPLGSMSAGAISKDHAAARQQAQSKSLNLRAMDIEKLQRTIKETQTEMEQARKEMEAVEKKWAKKGKEAGKWRETILKGKVMVGPD